MELQIKSTFGKPEIPSITKVANGVTAVVEFLNFYQRALRRPEFYSADGFLQVKVNETLEIGKQFRKVTQKSTEIDLHMADYSGRVSYYIEYLIDKRITGMKFSNAMKRLLDNAKRIHNEVEKISEGYNEISEKLQIIYSECELKSEYLEQQNERAIVRAEYKERKESINDLRVMRASVLAAASAVIFPPAAIFFGGIAAVETYRSKKHGKQAVEAREISNNLQNSLDAIRCFQNVVNEIRSIIGSIEAFWNYQVVNVEILVNTARECEEWVEMEDYEADRIVKQWKKLEDQFLTYNFVISRELKNLLILA